MKKNKNILKSASKKVVYAAIMAAILIVGKYILSFIPNLEIVTTLIVCFAYVLEELSIVATLVFCIVDMIIYPISLDVVISYFIYWNLLALLVVVLKRLGAKGLLPYLILSLIMTLFFGILTSFMNAILFDLNFWGIYTAGLLYYSIQVLSTLVFMNIGFKPITKQLEKLINK